MEAKKEQCADCKKEAQEQETSADGDIICRDCFQDNYFTCEDCGSLRHNDNARNTVEDNIICEKCADYNYYTCSECGRETKRDDAKSCESCENVYCKRCWGGFYCQNCDVSYCQNCEHETHENAVQYRSVQNTKIYQDTKTGSIVQSTRLFGVEIEVYNEDIEKTIEAIAEIPRAVGVQEDGSLGNTGVEFQTPPASGKKGERLIKRICAILDKQDFIVNDDCGLHIHIDGQGFIEPEEYIKIKNLWLFYMAIEDVILAFLPKKRRGNRYCIPFKRGYSSVEVARCNDRTELETLWYRDENEKNKKTRKGNKYDQSRYNGFNFHSLFANGHIELRHHSGTINADKILQWANLHCKILDKIATGSIGQTEAETMGDILTLTEKMTYLFGVLELTPDARDYFMQRARKFNPTLVGEGEFIQLDTRNACAA